MLIATAGHIDHGKTTLVRALTGVETDRLPEEKARGITIDLGFAYWRPDHGSLVGFVDVPGHQRYLGNMIAGLAGIDTALLVVAADDGIMPQTVEHVHILDLLAFRRCIVAITKCDRVDLARRDEVIADVAEALRETCLAGAEIFPVSGVQGTGLAELSDALAATRSATGKDPDHGFRMSIDRAFSVAGSGTVVTGTVWAGHAGIGDTLSLSPKGEELRVRDLQSAGEHAASIGPGQRCAVNLAGIETAGVHRGDWLVAQNCLGPTSRIDVSLKCVSALRHGARVRLHHGTSEVSAKVLVPAQRSLQPGAESHAQIVLDRPVTAVSGDRFILRSQSSGELICGGRIFDPHASDRRDKAATKSARLAAMALASAQEKLAALSDVTGVEADLERLARACNLSEEAATALARQQGIVTFGADQNKAISVRRFDRLGTALIEAVAAHHRAKPDEGGLTRRAARMALGEPVSAELFDTLVADRVAAKTLVAERGILRVLGHSPSFSQLEQEIWRKLLDRSETGRPQAITLADAAKAAGVSEPVTSALLKRRSVGGDLWQVTDHRYMLRQHVAQLVALAAELEATSTAGFTAAQFRDASGIGRNFIILLLEFFDRIGVTRRNGEARRMKPGWQEIVGEG